MSLFDGNDNDRLHELGINVYSAASGPEFDVDDGPPPEDDPYCWGMVNNDLVDGALAFWEYGPAGDLPKYWCYRDTLFSGLVRDVQARWFCIAAADDPDPCALVRVLHHRQLYKLAQVMTRVESLAGIPDEDLPFDLRRIARKAHRLWVCPPCGVAVRYTGQRASRPCGLTWLCPWCNARTAYAKYEHILRITAAPCYADCSPIVMRTFATSDILAGASGTFRDGFTVLRRTLREHAARLGIKGGLLIHTPIRPSKDLNETFFTHELALVGMHHAGMDFGAPWVYIAGAPIAAIEGQIYRCSNSSRETVLRRALFGADKDWDGLGVQQVGDEESGPILHYPVGWGAACLAPVGQFPELAWLDYEELTHGTARYHLLGSWKQPRRPTSIQGIIAAQSRRLAEMPEYIQQHGRRIRLQQANQARQQQAQNRRTEMLEAIRPHWVDLLKGAHRNGRPPKVRLATEFLQGQEMSPSVRDIRWIIEQLG